MSKLIKEYEMQTQITQAMMQQWGYSRRPTITNKKKQISVSGFDVLNPWSYRRLSQSAEPSQRTKNPENRNCMKVAEGLCKQFNYIVSYKPRQAKKQISQIKGLQPKTDIEVIEEDIQNVKRQIVENKNSNDLAFQFKLNNKLNKLFKTFHKVNKQKRIKLHHSLRESPKLTPQNSILNKFQPNIKYQFSKQRKRAESLLEPFDKLNETSYNASQKIETKIYQQKQVMELYKSKIEEMKNNAVKPKRVMTETNTIVKQNNEEPVRVYQMYKMKTKTKANYIDFDDIASKKQIKQKIFSKILRNRNSKFRKTKGMNLMFKYDYNQHAKQLLSGGVIKPVPRQQDIKSLQKPGIEVIDFDITVLAGPPRKILDYGEYQAELKNQKAHKALKMKKKFDY